MTRLVTAKRLVAASHKRLSIQSATAKTAITTRTLSSHALSPLSLSLPFVEGSNTATTSSRTTRSKSTWFAATAADIRTSNGANFRSFSTASKGSITKEQNDLVEQYAKQGDVLQAEQVLLLMQRQSEANDDNIQVYPNAHAYSTVLHAWLESEEAPNQLEAGETYEKDGLNLSYQAVDRATELLFQWRKAAFKSGFLLAAPNITLDYHAVLKAWIKVGRMRGAPQRAQYILELLEKDQGTSQSASPIIATAAETVESYNLVMACWGNSGEHMRGSMAQILFVKLQEYEEQQLLSRRGGGSDNKVKPDGTSYRNMIHAWVHSGESKAAFRATGHLMKLLRLLEKSEGQNDDLQPTMEDYNKIFLAWTTAKDKHSAEKSFSVLRLMEYAYMHRFSELRADIAVYRTILQAYARSDASSELGTDVDQVFEKIWDRNLVPDTDCFTFAIQTYANCALHKDLVEQNNQDAAWSLAQRAHELLDEMIRAVHKSDTVGDATTENYNTVLKGYTAVVTRDASEPALQLLERMESDDNSAPRPNAATYALVATIISKSPSTSNRREKSANNQVQKSQDLLRRAHLEYERDTTNEAARPDVFLYNALIRTCAAAGSSSSLNSEIAREETFRLALTTLQRSMKEMDVKPDPETFLFLLDASASLLSTPSAMQSRAMEQIFDTACQAGLVDHILLARFREVASPDLHTKLVLDVAQDEDDGTRVVPLMWSCNVTTKGLIVDRKKAPALTVDGEFFLTAKMKDNRMKRLRRGRNKRLLQGGRLRRVTIDADSLFEASLKDKSNDTNGGHEAKL